MRWWGWYGLLIAILNLSWLIETPELSSIQSIEINIAKIGVTITWLSFAWMLWWSAWQK